MTMTSHERDHAHDTERDDANRDPTASPGRASRTGQLAGPGGPKMSGLLMRMANTPAATGGISSDTATLMATAEASPSHGLPDGLRGELEAELGEGLGQVRMHDGPEAHAAAGALDARAYTVGNDIYFGSGAYAPETPGGRGLIAHEAAHVVQNGGTGAVGADMQLSSPGDAHEREAHAFGEAFGSGQPTATPVTRATSVGRAIVARAEADPVVIPKNHKTTAGASGKLTTKSASITPYVAVTKALTGPDTAVDVQATLMLSGTGTIEWPDLAPASAPSVEAGGGGAKSGDKTSANKGEVGVEKEIDLYTKKANEAAKDEQSFWSGLEVQSVKLIPGVSGGRDGSKSATGDKKSEWGAGLGVKCEVTLKNGTKVTGSVNVVSLKKGDGGVEIEGPNVTLVAVYNAVNWEKDLGKGVKVKAALYGTGTVVVKPNWLALAKEGAKLLLESGVAGAVEMAGNLAVIFGPALFFAAGLSMIEDENDLWQWAVTEAKECERGAAGLAWGTALKPNMTTGYRATVAHSAGEKAARQAIASAKITEEEYKARYDEFSKGSELHRQCLKTAEDKFFAAVRARARAMFQDSISMKVFKTEADVVSAWEAKARDAWLSALH